MVKFIETNYLTMPQNEIFRILLKKYKFEIPAFVSNQLKAFYIKNFQFISENEKYSVDLTKVVGTTHPKYIGRTWEELLFKNVLRGVEKSYIKEIKLNLEALLYENNQGNDSILLFHFVNTDEMYIAQGNHRVTALKFYKALVGGDQCFKAKCKKCVVKNRSYETENVTLWHRIKHKLIWSR